MEEKKAKGNNGQEKNEGEAEQGKILLQKEKEQSKIEHENKFQIRKDLEKNDDKEVAPKKDDQNKKEEKYKDSSKAQENRNQNPRKKNKGKNYIQNYSKKLNNLGGDAFEYMISYNISRKFFIEDINSDLKTKESNFNNSQELDINEIKKEIFNKLSPNNFSDVNDNKKKIKYISDFNTNITEYFSYQKIYDTIYIQSDSMSSGISSSEKEYKSDNNKNIKLNIKQSAKKKNMNKKDLTQIEFDLCLKGVKGENLLNYLEDLGKKERLIRYIESKSIQKEKNYNVCIEITIDSNDILTKKIPQLYKDISCFNFLYKTNNFFNEIKEKSLVSDSFSYFKEKTKFIDYTNDLIIMTISNGKNNNFKNIEKSIKEKRAEKSDYSIAQLDSISSSYNIYFIFYPKYDDEEIYKLSSQIEEQKAKILNMEEEKKKEKQEMRSKMEEQERKMKEQDRKILNMEEEKQEIALKMEEQERRMKDQENKILNLQKKIDDLLKVKADI